LKIIVVLFSAFEADVNQNELKTFALSQHAGMDQHGQNCIPNDCYVIARDISEDMQ